MHEQLQRAYYTQHSGTPAIVIRVIDDDIDVVDLSSGYNAFQAHVSRLGTPETSILALTSVAGSASGFVCPCAQLDTLTPARAYLLSASAIEIATNEPRFGQCEVYVRPAPARV